MIELVLQFSIFVASGLLSFGVGFAIVEHIDHPQQKS